MSIDIDRILASRFYISYRDLFLAIQLEAGFHALWYEAYDQCEGTFVQSMREGYCRMAFDRQVERNIEQRATFDRCVWKAPDASGDPIASPSTVTGKSRRNSRAREVEVGAGSLEVARKND